MNRFVAFLMTVVMLISLLVPSLAVSAEEQSQTDVLTNAVYYTCNYDDKNKQVAIEGTVNHDFMISHANYTISVIAILPGQDYRTVASDPSSEILAEASMSVKFTFYVEVSTNFERYSKYAILFCSPTGERLLAGEPQIPSVSSDFEYDSSQRGAFKGIYTHSASTISGTGAGTVIIDVDLAQMNGDTSDSILYPMKDSYIHIKRSYVSEIDKKIVAASVAGTRVYFRLLLNSTQEDLVIFADEGKKYGVPNMYSENVIEYIFTMTRFLAERYGESETFYGVIAGSRIDDVENENAIGDMSLEQYAEIYMLYVTVLENAVRSIYSKADIVIPISDINGLSQELAVERKIKSYDLLDALTKRLCTNVSGDFDCSVLVESNVTPLGITSANIGSGIDTAYNANTYNMSIDDLSVLYEYFNTLSARYGDAPTNVMYMWHSDSTLSGDALRCAYVYLYNRLATLPFVSSFVADFGDNYASVRNVFKYIDTDKGDNVVSPVSRYFSDTSWLCPQNPASRILLERSFSEEIPAGIIGSFQYLDFTSSSVFDCMNAGEGCKYIRSDYDGVGERALHIAADERALGESVECVGLFKYAENYIYTPYISLKLLINDKTASDSALYEITLSLGKDNARIEASGVVKNGDTCELFFDISDYSQLSVSDRMIINVRCITEASSELSVWLYELNGHSDKYTSEELSELIEALRLADRTDDSGDGDGFDYSVIVTVIGIFFALGAVAIGLLMVFRREDDSEKSSDLKK